MISKLIIFGGHFDYEKKTKRLVEITQMEVMEGFWEDSTHASSIQKEKNLIEQVVNAFNDLVQMRDDFYILCEMFEQEEDKDSADEALNLLESFEQKIADVERKTLLSDEMDPNNAIVNINAGAGGTESCDWASMLLRMISRWAESKKFKILILDHQEGDSAGLKSVTLKISGDYAYGLLKSESGVHRLVRISPFDSNNRRHTSFASIFVSPEVDDNIDIQIDDKDIRIDVYRSGGAGGQSVNTTDSAVRITHFPSGLVVTCQNERSQHKNKDQALKVLKSRLYELEMEKKRAKQQEVEASKKEIGWGAQIRSYVLHPYKMVKDHRSRVSLGTAEKVLDGDLDLLMDAFLRWRVMGEVADEQADDESLEDL